MKLTWVFISIVLGIALVYAMRRDLEMDKEFGGDLRNRIVGARLIKDGHSPYFYKWKPGDGTRYYDPQNFDSLKVANITATPFFHHLLAPIADLQQRRLSLLWVYIEYILFGITTLLAFKMSGSRAQQWAVAIVAVLFLFTEAWLVHIYVGQIYIFIPFLAMLFYFMVQWGRNLSFALVAGLIAASLIFIRPNTLFFFLAFLFLARQFSWQYLLTLLTPMLILAIWSVTNKHEFSLWKDYKANLSEQLKVHQALNPTIQQNTLRPHLISLEGIQVSPPEGSEIKKPVVLFSENGNVFVIVEKLFHRKPSVGALNILSLFCMVMVTALYYWRNHGSSYTLPSVALLGFTLYMISDLFSPYHRLQYYAVQWLFPLYIAAAFYGLRERWWQVCILVGLILNIVNIEWLKMEHTMGEYLMMASLYGIALTGKPKTNP